MQSNMKEIYALTAKRTENEEQLYKDIGTKIFSSLREHLKRPPSLIIKIKGLGAWYLRKKRMEITLDEYPVDENSDEDKIALHNNFRDRLLDYDEFLKQRDALRVIRRKTQFIINIDKDGNAVDT